jgi:hypothetical protein
MLRETGAPQISFQFAYFARHPRSLLRQPWTCRRSASGFPYLIVAAPVIIHSVEKLSKFSVERLPQQRRGQGVDGSWALFQPRP